MIHKLKRKNKKEVEEGSLVSLDHQNLTPTHHVS